MIFQVSIHHVLSKLHLQVNLLLHALVHCLHVVQEILVLLGHAQVMESLCKHSHGLNGVEVLLVHDEVSHGLLRVVHLPELYVQHVVQRLKVLPHVFDLDSARNVVS